MPTFSYDLNETFTFCKLERKRDWQRPGTGTRRQREMLLSKELLFLLKQKHLWILTSKKTTPINTSVNKLDVSSRLLIIHTNWYTIRIWSYGYGKKLQNMSRETERSREIGIESDWWSVSQQTLACSKSTLETLEKGVKYVQSLQ